MKSDAPLKIVGYSDSDFVGYLDTRNPHQDIYSHSQMELYRGQAPKKAMFVACYATTEQAVCFKKFAPKLRVGDSIKKSLKIYYDNEPVLQYSYNNKKSDAANHINIKYYVVKKKIQDHTISLKHISNKRILVDPLTKDLPLNVFMEHVADMGLRKSL
jgi:hypothetical protein